ncbi:aspartate--tRNA ligase, mitochondrial-like [Physella acuta]|uniref:aspartate--tRNA ligase, mitochondrial-like n=1 Tax=Physella acuta TaxID=109671 RepID=UPI0027DBC7DB|nr:aspartate--tRNA ligase, mitochondrial-like [Physella acuta]
MATPISNFLKLVSSNVFKSVQCRSSHASVLSDCTSFTRRSHLCGELRDKHVGESVTLCGWLQFHRLSGAFIVLRDWLGSIQLVIPETKVHEFKDLPLESVLQVKGQVCLRPSGQENKDMPTGDVEVQVQEISVLNTCTKHLPFEVQNFNKVKESLRIKHRYLELRLQNLQKVLRLRSKFVMSVRDFLANGNGFVEVETPTLFKRTPGGAREFIVPTSSPGKFYSLPQSPQQFKQLLMVGGLDRYFQIARCYRDEGTKPDRQPEFTQIDLEMSFVTQEAVISLVEQLLQATWPEECGQVAAPFPKMAYQEAMTFYGCDKPDLRLDWKIQQLTSTLLPAPPAVFQDFLSTDGSTLQALRVPEACQHLSNKELEDILRTCAVSPGSRVKLVAAKIKAGGSWGSSLDRQLDTACRQRVAAGMQLQPHDWLLLAAGQHYQPHQVLGQVRLNAASLLESKGIQVRQEGFKFLWVDNFPLFLPKEDGGEGLESAHHPFTAPHPDDLDLIYTSPEQVRGQHYDLVLNGSEIGGGSIRIHSSKLQSYVLSEVLKEDSSELEHLLFALDCGCPPHGGIALGLDRLMSIMCGTESIRDVIAFPKITGGKDPLSNSPASVAPDDLKYYHISLDTPAT